MIRKNVLAILKELVSAHRRQRNHRGKGGQHWVLLFAAELWKPTNNSHFVCDPVPIRLPCSSLQDLSWPLRAGQPMNSWSRERLPTQRDFRYSSVKTENNKKPLQIQWEISSALPGILKPTVTDPATNRQPSRESRNQCKTFILRSVDKLVWEQKCFKNTKIERFCLKLPLGIFLSTRQNGGDGWSMRPKNLKLQMRE